MRDDATYEEAAHAVQSGVAFHQQLGSEGGSLKNLRTGLDLRAADACALAKLMIAKGLITEEEYVEAIRLETIAEARRYEKLLSGMMGKVVILG